MAAGGDKQTHDRARGDLVATTGEIHVTVDIVMLGFEEKSSLDCGVPTTHCTTSAGNRRGGAWFYAAAVVSWRRLERRAVRMAVVAMRPALVRW